MEIELKIFLSSVVKMFESKIRLWIIFIEMSYAASCLQDFYFWKRAFSLSTPTLNWIEEMNCNRKKFTRKTFTELGEFFEKNVALLKVTSPLLVIQFIRIVFLIPLLLLFIPKKFRFLMALCMFSFRSLFFCQTNYWNKFKEFVFPRRPQHFLNLSGIGVTEHENCCSSDVCSFFLSPCHST